MAKCEVTGKSVSFGKSVSHSHRKSNRTWKANIKRVKVKLPGGGTKRMKVCVSALRSGLVERA